MRKDEARKLEAWKKRREEEILASTALIDEIDKEWVKIEKKGGPYMFSELLAKQKAACNGVIAVKNKLVNEYVAELKTKDDEYVKELKRQSEEIDKLLERMDEQYKKFQSILLSELEAIETAFVTERNELIESNSKELNLMFELRRSNEAYNVLIQ